MSGLCKLLTWGKVGAGDDVELGVVAGLGFRNLREFHDRYFPLLLFPCLPSWVGYRFEDEPYPTLASLVNTFFNDR